MGFYWFCGSGESESVSGSSEVKLCSVFVVFVYN